MTKEPIPEWIKKLNRRSRLRVWWNHHVMWHVYTKHTKFVKDLDRFGEFDEDQS